MKTFFSKVVNFFQDFFLKKPSLRLFAERLGIVVKLKGYETLVFRLYDISLEGFSVVLDGFLEEERSRFLRGFLDKRRDFEFIFYLADGVEVKVVEVSGRFVSFYEGESRFVFYVRRGKRRGLRGVYEYVLRRVKDEEGERGIEGERDVVRDVRSCGVGCLQLEQVQKLYYLSLLEEKRLAVREKKFKLSFLVVGVLLFFVMGSLFDMVGVQYSELKLREKIREYEEKHNAKVLYLVHRKRQLGIWGMPVYEYLEVYDAHRLLKELQGVPEDKEVVLVVHSPGGQLLAGLQIAKILKERKGKVKVVVPFFAMSAGTLIALSADEVYAGEGATFGPIDPQVPYGGREEMVSAVMVKRAYEEVKGRDLKSAVVYQMSISALKQMESFMREVLLVDYREEDKQRLIKRFLYTEKTHDFPIFVEELRSLGVNVKVGIPTELKEIVFPILETSNQNFQYLKY